MSYRVTMRLLGILLLGAGLVISVPWIRVVIGAAEHRAGSGPMILPAPPGWMMAVIIGAVGLAVVGCLAALGIGALLLRRWAAWATLFLGIVALAIGLAVQLLLFLLGDQTNVLAVAVGPAAVVALAGISLWLSRRGTAGQRDRA